MKIYKYPQTNSVSSYKLTLLVFLSILLNAAISCVMLMSRMGDISTYTGAITDEIRGRNERYYERF